MFQLFYLLTQHIPFFFFFYNIHPTRFKVMPPRGLICISLMISTFSYTLHNLVANDQHFTLCYYPSSYRSPKQSRTAEAWWAHRDFPSLGLCISSFFLHPPSVWSTPVPHIPAPVLPTYKSFWLQDVKPSKLSVFGFLLNSLIIELPLSSRAFILFGNYAFSRVIVCASTIRPKACGFRPC